MMSGLPSVEDRVAQHDLSVFQRLRLRAMLRVVSWFRDVLYPHLGQADSPLKALLAGHQHQRLRALGSLRRNATHPHAMSQDEVELFEREGVSAPFSVLAPQQALALAEAMRGRVDRDFRTANPFPRAYTRRMRAAGLWNLRYAGLFQALRVPELFDLFTAPAITERLASLLGDDVLLWRSQFFEMGPGDGGTFWHQNSSFRELADQRKLRPPAGRDQGMIQLSVWIALSEVTVRNGAMRIMPGSFVDGRIEHIYEFSQDHTMRFLASLPPDRLEAVLRLGLFHPDRFARVQCLFDACLQLLGRQHFERWEVRDILLKPGQAIIFTSLNMHGSYPNVTADQRRLAAVGRYVPGDTAIFPDMRWDRLPTPRGHFRLRVDDIPAVQAFGRHERQLNRVVTRCQPQLWGGQP